jgi:hypothetical protein
MSLPPDFSYTENFQDGIKKVLNHDVNEWFRDVKDGNATTERAQLKRLCLHLEGDSIGETQTKITFFQYLRGTTIERLLLTNAIPDQKYKIETQQQIPASNHPQIFLYFSQPGESVAKGVLPITAECSFRIMDKVKIVENQGDEIIRQSHLEVLARKIANNFRDFYFTKGDLLFLYNCPEKGFFGTQCYAMDEHNALSVFRNLCQVQGIVLDEKRIKKSGYTKRKSVSKSTRKVTAYDSKQKTEPLWRPIARVKFTHAIADCGLNERLPLVDFRGILHGAFVKR